MKLTTLICGILTTVVAFTAVKIEVLNVQNGSPLPRKEFDGRIPTWRVAARTILIQLKLQEIAALRSLNGPESTSQAEYDPDQLAIELPLTDEELWDLFEAIEKADRNGEFRGFVGTMGIAQYLLAPTALLFSIIHLREKQSKADRLTIFLTLSVSFVAILLMFYRGYFSSLGI